MNPLARLLPLALLLTGCAHHLAYRPDQSSLPTPRAQVPMMISPAGLPEIDALVAGQRIRCFVDTGAFATTLAPALAARAHLTRLPGYTRTVDGAGNTRVSPVVTVPSCSVGAATLANFAAVERDLDYITPILSTHTARPAEAILSPSLFYDFLWTLDFATGRMTLEHGQLPPPDNKEILTLHLSTTGRPMVPVSVAGQELWFLMDTGFTEGLAVPEWAVPAFPGAANATPAGTVHFHYGTADASTSRLNQDVTLGQHVLAHPLLTHTGRDLILGAAYLKHFTITIDQRHHRIRFHRTDTSPLQS